MELFEIPRKIGKRTNACYVIDEEANENIVFTRLVDECASYEVGRLEQLEFLSKNANNWRMLAIKTTAFDNSYVSFQVVFTSQKRPQALKMLVQHYENGGVVFCSEKEDVELLVEKREIVNAAAEIEEVISVSIFNDGRQFCDAEDRLKNGEESSTLVIGEINQGKFELSEYITEILKFLMKESSLPRPEAIRTIQYKRRPEPIEVYSYESAPRHYLDPIIANSAFIAPKDVAEEPDWFYSKGGKACFVSTARIGAEKLVAYCKIRGYDYVALYSKADSEEEDIHESQLMIYVGNDMIFRTDNSDGSIYAIDGWQIQIIFTQPDESDAAHLCIFQKNDDDAIIEYEQTEAHVNDEKDIKINIEFDWQKVAIATLRKFPR